MTVVAVVREEIENDAAPDALDTLRQAEAVCESLERGGWTAAPLVLRRDPLALEEELRALRPELVFNLVESYCGLAMLACAAPPLYRRAGLPFTGADECAMTLAADKAAARRIMAATGIPAPAGTNLQELRQGRFPGAGRYIIKSRFEDASLGLGEDCVIDAGDGAELLRAMETVAPRMGGDCVAERYVDGREFNLALLAGPGGVPRVLPLAEMVFDPRLTGPAILHYAAKWHEDSDAFAASARSFALASDTPADEMTQAAIRCWEVFGLAGYARIDFRLSEKGEIFVIDVNPNPCIAPDSGFVAAAGQAGLDHARLVRDIVTDALNRTFPGGNNRV